MHPVQAKWWTRAIVLIALFAGANVTCAADPFLIVSDVDDTVKITNVRRPAHAAVNALKSELVFAGMSELYTQMLGPGSDRERLRFISGSSRVLDQEINEALIAAGFPAYNLTLRRIRDSFVSARTFKSERLKVLYGSVDGQYILIGDDTEADPEVYVDFASAKPGKVLAIYIRRVTGRKLPDGIISFVTAYDIAVQELAAGRLSEQQVAAVAGAVLASSAKTLLPDFHVCPSDFSGAATPDDLFRSRIQARLSEICTARE